MPCSLLLAQILDRACWHLELAAHFLDSMRYYLTSGGIMPKGVANQRYTLEFKEEVIRTMQEEKLGYCKTEGSFCE